MADEVKAAVRVGTSTRALLIAAVQKQIMNHVQCSLELVVAAVVVEAGENIGSGHVVN